MNLILDGLPEVVEIAGTSVKIDTSFRTGIIFEEMLSDPELTDDDKLLTMLELYYPGIVFDETTFREAIEKIFWFYRCGSEPRQTAGGDEGGETVFSLRVRRRLHLCRVYVRLSDRPSKRDTPLVAVSGPFSLATGRYADNENHRLQVYENFP